MKKMKKLFVFLVVLGFFMAGNVWANTVTLQFNPMDVFNYATSDNTMLNQQGTARRIEAESSAGVFRTYNDYRDAGHTDVGDLAAVANILGWTGAWAGYQGVSNIQLWLVGGGFTDYWGEKVVMKPNTTLSASVNGEYDWTPFINPYGEDLFIASYNTELTGEVAHQNALSTFHPAQELWSVTGDFFIDNNGNGIYDEGDTDLVIGQQYTIWFGAVINNWPYYDGVSPDAWGSPTLVQGTIIATVNVYDQLRAIVNGGCISKNGIVNSLLSKIKNAEAAEKRGDLKARAGIMGAFINEVQAQTGKAIDPMCAAELIRLAQLL